jgi:translocation and assembly module TamB
MARSPRPGFRRLGPPAPLADASAEAGPQLRLAAVPDLKPGPPRRPGKRRLRRRGRRRLHRVLLLLAALLMLLGVAGPLGVVYYVCYTEQGLQLIAGLVPRQMGDIEVDIAGVSGTVAHGLRVARVDVDERLVHVTVEGVHGHVTMAALLLQTVRSRDAYFRKVTVRVKPHPQPPRHWSPPSFMPSWLLVSLDHAHIAHADVVTAGGTHLTGDDLETSTTLRHKSIYFYDVQLQHDDTHVSGIGELRAAEPMKMDIKNLRMHWVPQTQPDWLIEGTLKGDLNSVALTAHTIHPFRSDFTGRMLSLNHGNRWRWLGNSVVKDFDLAAWHAGGMLGVMTGELHLQGDVHGFTAEGTVVPQGLNAGLFDIGFHGWYQDHVLTAERMDVRHRTSGATATGHGTFGIVKNGPLLDIQGSWKDFRWPLVGPPDVPFRSSSADFTLTGILPYHATARGTAKIAQLPPWPMQIDGTLGHGGFKLADGEVDLYEGHAKVRGEVTWSGEHTWSLESELRDVSLGAWRADLPGHVSFSVAARGDSFTANEDLDIEVRGLDGTVRGQPARGSGHMTRTQGVWEFDNVHANLGKTRLDLDGHIAQSMDLRFSVAAEDLSLLSPDSRGMMRAMGNLRGTLQTPQVTATVHGTGIHHEGVTLDDVDALIDFDPHPQRESKVDIKVRNLRTRNRTLDSFSLSLTGRPESYTLRSQAKAEGLAAAAVATGSYHDGIFGGQVDTLSISSGQSTHLDLTKPVGLTLSPAHARVEWLCVKGRPASICATGDWTAAQWAATVQASELPIETLTSGLEPAPSVSYEGTVNVSARLSGNDTDPVQGTVNAELSNAQLSHTLLSRRVEHTTIGSGTIQVQATKTAVTAKAALQDGQIGTVRADLTAQRSAPQWRDMPVQGELHAQTGQLELLSLYMPDIDRASGHLTADAQISGTLGTPYLAGQLRLADAEMDLYQVNLRLRQLQLAAQLTATGVDFKGHAHIGKGDTNASGHLEWHDSLPYGKLTLKGENLRVVDLPEAHIDASPDLSFSIAGKQVEVAGSVDVPYAKIEPRDLSAAVRTSADEKVVGAQQQELTRHFDVKSLINLRLGDKVNIVTTGLTARLQGNLAVSSGYDASTRATGQLSVLEGKYVAYAHNFDIQSGTLIFTGGPVDNPGIDIKAARKFPAVTAGVKVRGTLMQPRISFFSEPSLPQAEIVSLILSGGSLASAQSRDHAAGAGGEALVQGGAVLLQQIGSQVGIEDIGVQSNPYTINETSLVLGKYLSPRLYVSYGVGLTEQLQVLKLRYSLGDHWTVISEMGQARGADLEFSIDR